MDVEAGGVGYYFGVEGGAVGEEMGEGILLELGCVDVGVDVGHG